MIHWRKVARCLAVAPRMPFSCRDKAPGSVAGKRSIIFFPSKILHPYSLCRNFFVHSTRSFAKIGQKFFKRSHPAKSSFHHPSQNFVRLILAQHRVLLSSSARVCASLRDCFSEIFWHVKVQNYLLERRGHYHITLCFFLCIFWSTRCCVLFGIFYGNVLTNKENQLQERR